VGDEGLHVCKNEIISIDCREPMKEIVTMCHGNRCH
jgi:hypothetical protein